MKIPFFPSVAVGDPSGVISLALHELGLSEAFLLRALLAAGGSLAFKGRELDYEKMGFAEWVWICQKLHLSVDCISYGYSSKTHRAQVGAAILDGAYVFPMTDRSHQLFREYVRQLRNSNRRDLESYGEPLLSKVRHSRIEERNARLRLRRVNRKIGKRIRQRYAKLFNLAAVGAPILLSTPNTPLKGRRLDMPGLRRGGSRENQRKREDEVSPSSESDQPS